jgi:ABC-type transport system involved in multi-copper enzyme maturation permease subunit
MSRVGYIALNTYRETVRDKVLYNLVFFALLMIASSYVLGKISVYQEVKIIKDLGLASISVFGMVIAVFIGIGLVSKEIEKRTLYSVLPKPVSRTQFILGKYFGLCLTLLVNVAIMSVGFFLLLGVMGESFELGLLKAIVLIYVNLMLLVGVAIFYSTFTSPTLAGLFTGFTYIAGFYSSDLKNTGSVVDSDFLPRITGAIYYLLPNFRNFDIKTLAVAGAPLPLSQIGWSIAYGLAYASLLIVGSAWVFRDRNLR